VNSEIEQYQPPRHEVDSWVEVLAPVGDLATRIAGTEFVPESLRGKPAAVAAAILTGREMDIGPMVSLRHIHVIKGRPGQSAELMRALVMRHGHQIRYIDTNDTRCVVEGRRRGDEEWTQVTFTADQARRAKIDLGGYPEDKLVARATSRLCRRIFPDVVAGMPYTTDELEDLDAEVVVVDMNGEVKQAPTKTARRRVRPADTGTGTTGGVTSVDGPTARSAPRAAVPLPPLPGEPGYEDAAEQPAKSNAPEPITDPQMKKVHTVLGVIGLEGREARLTAASVIVGRQLNSSTELTKDEASMLIDTLEQVADGPDPRQRLADLLDAVSATENPPAQDGEEGQP